MSAPAT